MNWSRVEGHIGEENLRRLRNARVGVVGLGSGGGAVALNLAMCGVGSFVLVDDDALEAGNVVRHVCDLRAVGQAKVDAVAALIRQRNPEVKTETHIARIQEAPAALNGLDLLVVGVDGERAKLEINEACIANGLTAIYAGVYERGEGGDVALIHHETGPCYACWSARLRFDLIELSEGPALDYGLPSEQQALQAEPGLWLDVLRVAAAQSHFALAALLSGDDAAGNPLAPLRGNTLVMANRDLEIFAGVLTPAQGAVWLTIERNPECLICGEAMRGAAAGPAEQESAPVSLAELSASIDDDDRSEDSPLT